MRYLNAVSGLCHNINFKVNLLDGTDQLIAPITQDGTIVLETLPTQIKLVPDFTLPAGQNLEFLKVIIEDENGERTIKELQDLNTMVVYDLTTKVEVKFHIKTNLCEDLVTYFVVKDNATTEALSPNPIPTTAQSNTIKLPADTSLTNADIGKIVMQDPANGKVVVYREIGVDAVFGIYDIKVDTLSTHMNVGYITLMTASQGGGLSGGVITPNAYFNNATTIEQEATNLADYLNATYSGKLTATVTNNVVRVVYSVGGYIVISAAGSNISIENITDYAEAIPPMPLQFAIGVLKSVANGNAEIINSGIVEVKLTGDFDVTSLLSLKATLFPTNEGAIKLFVNRSVTPSLSFAGIAVSTANRGEKIKVYFNPFLIGDFN